MLQVCKTYSNGIPCHYLIERYILNGQPRLRILFRLEKHSTLEEALEYWRVQEQSADNSAGRQRASDFVRLLSHHLSSDRENSPNHGS